MTQIKINGYQLREILRRWSANRDVAGKQFKESLFQFEDEMGIIPEQVATNFAVADQNVSFIQSLQQMYNQRINIDVMKENMTLSEGVKRLSGAGRLEKMWRDAAVDTGRDRYHSRSLTKNKDEVNAKRMTSAVDCNRYADQSSRFASALRSAIADANSKVLTFDIPDEMAKVLSD